MGEGIKYNHNSILSWWLPYYALLIPLWIRIEWESRVMERESEKRK